MSDFIVKKGLDLLVQYSIGFIFEGDSSILITHARSVEAADDGSVCFFRGETFDRYKDLPSNRNLFIINSNISKTSLKAGNYIFTDMPDLCFCIIAALLLPDIEPSIHPSAIISETAVMGRDVSVGTYVRIGDDVVIGNNVIIGDGCIITNAVIGDRTHIYPGVKIGSPGLGSHKGKNGKWHDFPHFGKVIIGSATVVQDNTVINCGTMGDTVLETGVRVGPLCWIGHGVFIGRNCFIGQGVTIAGSSKISEGTKIWGNASIRDGVTIGRASTVGMGSVVTRDIPSNETWVGSPARKISKLKKMEDRDEVFFAGHCTTNQRDKSNI